MKRKIHIGPNVLDPALRYALSDEAFERDFFSAFRSGIKWRVEKLLEEVGAAPTSPKPLPQYFRPKKPLVSLDPIRIQGQSLDADFCSRYGFTESSVSALNYLYDGARENSLLPFLESDSFTIGNFLFRLEPGDYELDVEFNDGVTATGYVADIRPRSVESFLVILGLGFASEVIKAIASPLPEPEKLDELAPCAAPPLWINRRTGQVFTCLCFSYMAKRMWRRQAKHTLAGNAAGEAEILMRPGLCSICSDHVPPPKVTNAGHCNSFLRRYAPYQRLFHLKMFDGVALSIQELKDAERIAENAARLAVGYPLIGQKWISETTLYRTVRSLLAPRIVVQHYQGQEMDGQEIDVWVPSLRLAIEYHGAQHYQALSAWGGDTALAAAKERDERKRKKLAELGYHLLEFQHDEQFTEETVLERIRPYIV
jgi:very-short-patch-repair endonuclease